MAWIAGGGTTYRTIGWTCQKCEVVLMCERGSSSCFSSRKIWSPEDMMTPLAKIDHGARWLWFLQGWIFTRFTRYYRYCQAKRCCCESLHLWRSRVYSQTGSGSPNLAGNEMCSWSGQPSGAASGNSRLHLSLLRQRGFLMCHDDVTGDYPSWHPDSPN